MNTKNHPKRKADKMITIIKQGHISARATIDYKHFDKVLAPDFLTKDIVTRIFNICFKG